MRESRIFKAWGQGCARSLIIRVVVSVVVISGFGCLTIGAYLLPIDEDIKVFVWVGIIIAFMLTLFGGVIAWGIQLIRKRGSELDQAFTPLGLEGRMYLTNGRQYHGSYRGYQVHAYFSRGPTVAIYLDVALKTRVGIGRKGAIEGAAANILDKVPLQVADPEFEHLVVYPLDKVWTAELLADDEARAAILRLTREEAATELRSFSVMPEALLMQARYIPTGNINPEVVSAWVNDLYEVARIANRLPSANLRAEESKIEAASRSDRGKFTWPIIGITCSVFAVMAICILIITAVLIYIEESGI